MAAMSDYLEEALLNAVLRNTAYTSPATVYLALFTTATTDAGGGTEVTGGSYARQAIAFDAPSSPGGTTQNTAVESFTNMPACTVTHAAIMDASSGGNMLFHAALAAPKTLGSGETLTFQAGDVDIQIA